MNLVLIGTFKHARDAENVDSFIAKLIAQATKDDAFSIARSSAADQRFSEEMLALLSANKTYSLAPAELEQLASENHIDRRNKTITIRTDEADVSAFIKIFIDAGARIEVYSAHDYPDPKADQARS